MNLKFWGPIFVVMLFCQCSSNKFNNVNSLSNDREIGRKPYFIENWLTDQRFVDSANYYVYIKSDYQNALRNYKKAASYPRDLSYQIATCYIELGDTVTAVNYYNKALSYGFTSRYITDPKIKSMLNQKLVNPQSVSLECELLQSNIRDQIPRKPNFKIPESIYQEYKTCIDSFALTYTDREVNDSINLDLLNALKKEGRYPTIKDIKNDYILDIPSTIILHQSKEANDDYIAYYDTLTRTKQIPYYQFFKIIGNRIKRFTVQDCTNMDADIYVSTADENYNRLKSIVYSAHEIIVNNPQYTCYITLPSSAAKEINLFVKKFIPTTKVTIEYNDDEFKICFKK